MNPAVEGNRVVMQMPIVVQVVGAPVACAGGVKETWRDVANWAAGQLAARYGAAVRLDYWDLFDPGCPQLPPSAQLPVVLVNGEVVSSGTKLSLPDLCRWLEGLGLRRPLVSLKI
jgi:disulfide oxidoreductase YuzD